MSVIAPPSAPQQHDDLEALIEEARRRARRRRLIIGAGVAAALLVAGAGAGIFVATRGGGGANALPVGLHAVQARGPVQRAVLEALMPNSQTVRLSDGSVRRTRQTQEVWWNPGTKLYRTIYRSDGIVNADVVQQQCLLPHHRFCQAPPPFDLQSRGFGWQPRKNYARRVGTGTFRGHRVLWVEGLIQAENGTHPLSGDQVAYDVVTHRPVELRTITRSGPRSIRGHVRLAMAVTFLPRLAGKDVSFAVPDGGAPLNLGANAPTITSFRASLSGAREVLGRSPLWLGRVYRGHRLRSIETGREGSQNARGGNAAMAPFVRLDYGPVQLEEFGDVRPVWLLHAPPAGELFADPGRFTYGHDGIVLQAIETGRDQGVRFDRDVARALRPVR